MDPFQNATFDPWSGKSLGEVEKPQGFDDYWKDQEAVQRGEKEPEELDPVGEKKGKSRGKGGKGFRRSRYNVVPKPPPRARPTHFVAIRLFSRMIRRNVHQMQQWFIAKNPLFEHCLVPVRRLHSSLLLTSIPPERRGEAQEACHEAGEEIRDFLGDQPVKIVASGISSFNGQILFTRLRTEPHDMLQAIHDALSSSFMRHGFPVLDESAKSWLEEGEEPHDFKAHASFIKVSKALAHAKSDSDKRKFRSLRLASDDLDAWRDVFFGTQICTEFELLDMIGSSRDGYYPCLQLEHFHDRTIVVNEPSLDVSLAAGPVRTAKLRVDQQAGAGLQLSACEAGYLVEELEEWPGQPEIRAGDVIVAIGEELLIGLSEAKIEEEFGKNFENGALTIVGPAEMLQKMQLEHVRRATNRLLRPWKEERGASSVGSVGSVLVTSASGVPRGKRHRFRVTAAEFRPDPLNQPGGDPWANAAAAGYVYPEYTGWGTKFKKRKATVVDSTRFLPKPKPVQVDERGFFENKELTKVHQRLNQNLRRATCQEKVLSIIKEEKGLLSTSNRVAAIARLASLDRWSSECIRDPRLEEMLKDLLDDLEAIEESQVTLPPYTLASLALGMARLGLRHPEIFRCLGQVVRRSGLWSFGDHEAASLLEGFSRARRCDEVIFQEASRLIMARMDRMEPKILTNMMTAFACANIAIETLFFAVGDCVLRRLDAWSLRQLAELADAFARVRARHALLLDVVPSRCEKAIPSIEALVLLFSAYVDSRQGFGPEGLREDLAKQLLERQGELSATLMRRLLQCIARARWPSHALLEAACKVAAREPSKEVDAMFDCFLQLRVEPPADFPISDEKRKHREERLKAREERSQRWKEKQSQEDEAPAIEESVPEALRICRLRVEREGASLELEACGAGYLVNDCFAEQSLQPGDIIVAIEGHLLVDLTEDEVEEKFGAEFCHGASLLVGTFDELQHFSLKTISKRASEILKAKPDQVLKGVESPAEGNQSMSVKASTGLVQDMMDIHVLEAPKSGAAESKIQKASHEEEEKSVITEKSRSGRGKNGLRSTGTDDKSKGKREDRKTSTSETKEEKKADSGTSKVTRVEWNDSEKKSYYQPLPRAKGNGRGSGQRVWRPKG